MSYAAIITQVQCDSDAAPRLACAIDMAERFDAALIGVGAEMIPPLAFDGGLAGIEAQWITAMRGGLETRMKLAKQSFTEAAKGLGARASWLCGIEMPAPAIAAASRAADLVIAGAGSRKADAYCTAAPAELALICGRPVLVAPSQGRTLSAKSVLLAWKDTREARRALSDALPFLLEADEVHVVEACAADASEDAAYRVADVSDALKRRGVKALSDVLVQSHPNGGHLTERARQVGADLVVCGAYGHSRLGEWVFGGVTQDLLEQDEHYVLLSH